MNVVLRGRFQPSDARHYTHLPFEVPPGVRALQVAYDYSERIASDPGLRGGNTLDIGLFDPRGFRGWSGSHQLEFAVGATRATPPYAPGPILAGTWQVLLGAYKVSPRGCEFEVSIRFSDTEAEPTESDDVGTGRLLRQAQAQTEPEPPDESAVRSTRDVRQAQRRRESTAEAGWLRGDLHCHTRYSDGDSWPAEMLAHAVERGLDFLGVTDHNGTQHLTAYARVKGEELPIILPGIEVTTYGGHWNAWGTDTWWDFREPTEAATTRAMQAAAASGAVVSVNHPKPFGPPWEYPNARGFHAVEVWNGAWHEHNDVALAWWDSLLRAGRRVVAVGGSDTHHLQRPEPADRLGRPTTWAYVGADRSVAGVLSALRKGQVFISHDVDGPQLYLTRNSARVLGGAGATLRLLTRGCVDTSVTVASDDWTTGVVTRPESYVRAELARGEEMLALTNPLWM